VQSVRRPNHPAIACNGRIINYRELDRLANRFAHYFRSLGIGPGRLVALHLGKSIELFAALIGVLKAGGGYVPIDPKFPADRISSILEDGQIRVVVSQTSLATTGAQDSSVQTLLVDRDLDNISAMSDA